MRKSDADGEGNVVAETEPVRMVADCDGLQGRSPCLRKKDIVDVIPAALAMPKIISGARLLALGL